jgi:hypothetical protein
LAYTPAWVRPVSQPAELYRIDLFPTALSHPPVLIKKVMLIGKLFPRQNHRNSNSEGVKLINRAINSVRAR